MLDIKILKAILLAGLFLLTLFFSMLPLLLISISRRRPDSNFGLLSKRIISLCSCYAGGVFLASGLLDLFPDVRIQIEDFFLDQRMQVKFPISEFVMVFGFLIILVVEQIVLTCKETGGSENRPLLSPTNPHHSYNNIKGNSYASENDLDETVSAHTAYGESQRNNWQYSVHQDPESHSKMRSLLLLMAISLHSIFEGLAVGLESRATQVMEIFAALVLHKCIIAFSLGINLVQSRLTRGALIRSNFGFSLTSPIGIGIGMGIIGSNRSPYTKIVGGILQGIACGTFLYITFFEILPHEMNKSTDRLLKVLVLILGFSTMCVLLYFIPS